MPALPLGEAGKYVAAAYIVFLVLIVVYVGIMAAKLQRIERDLRELAGFAESRAAGDQRPRRRQWCAIHIRFSGAPRDRGGRAS